MKDQAQKLRDLIGYSKQASGQIPVEMPPVEVKEVSPCRIITITSGKGGVGKTNFTVNLGISLSKAGKKVTLIDADLGLANIDVVLGIVPKYTLFHMIKEQKTIDEILLDGPEGIKIISGGSGVMDLVNLNDTQIENMMESFKVLHDNSDFLLIDTGAGLNHSVMTFVEAASEVILVVTPDPTSITDAYAVIKNMSQQGKPIKIVVNRIESNQEGYDVFHKISSACKKFLNVELENLGFVYEDIQVRRAVKQQKPFILNAPTSIASKGIDMISFNLIHNSNYVNNGQTLTHFIKRIFSSI
jgi:flagellar biosynthesis protein FlhG